MTTYLSRSAWTTSSVGGSTLTGLSLVGVAVHWPGTSQAAIGVQSQSATASRLRGYRDFHVGTRGWSDIGYNLAIDQAGRVWMLRSTSWAGNRVGAHCASPSNPNANHKYVGVLLILGQSEQPSTAMIDAFGDWYHTRFLPVWKGRTDVRGHGQVPGAQTNCPGTRAKARIADGTLAEQPQEDDMPTAAEVAKELLDTRVENRVTGKTIQIRDLLPYMHEDGVQINTTRLPRIEAKVDGIAGKVGWPIDMTAIEHLTAELAVTRDLLEQVAAGQITPDRLADELAARLAD